MRRVYSPCKAKLYLLSCSGQLLFYYVSFQGYFRFLTLSFTIVSQCSAIPYSYLVRGNVFCAQFPKSCFWLASCGNTEKFIGSFSPWLIKHQRFPFQCSTNNIKYHVYGSAHICQCLVMDYYLLKISSCHSQQDAVTFKSRKAAEKLGKSLYYLTRR